MNKVLLEVDKNKYRGCRRCEMACSWGQGGITNPRFAGIKIFKNEAAGKDYPVFNQNCYDQYCGKEHPREQGKGIPLCVTTCIFGAISI